MSKNCTEGAHLDGGRRRDDGDPPPFGTGDNVVDSLIQRRLFFSDVGHNTKNGRRVPDYHLGGMDGESFPCGALFPKVCFLKGGEGWGGVDAGEMAGRRNW